MPEPEPVSYARRFFAKLRHETFRYAKQKLLTGASVGAMAVIVRLILGKLQVINVTSDQAREIWISLLILLGAYVLVFLGSFIVNLFRTPALLDQERAGEIALLKGERDGAIGKLQLVKPFVSPREYRKHNGESGLIITNPKYAAYDVQIPPVLIGSSGYTLYFDRILSQLHDWDREQFLESRLEHPTMPGCGGGELFTVMQHSETETVNFVIIYKDDKPTWYETESFITVDQRERFGLRVGHRNQNIIPAPVAASKT